jgi:magnesium-transporting ATPase (P-type)
MFNSFVMEGVGPGRCDVLSNVLVIIVGGVPIAMPTVVSVTLALGAQVCNLSFISFVNFYLCSCS